MRRLRLLLGLFPLLVLAACGEDAPTVTSAEPASAGQEHEASGTVLESPTHGPELCLGGVAESYPPQCGGVPLVGWEWAEVEGEESANGTTWGDYRVVGTWDGERLTLTEEPGAPRREQQRGPELTTPCPAPPGGWSVADHSKATEEAQHEAIEHAQRQPSFAGVWIDQSINPASKEDPMDEETSMAMNDPTKLVLNLRFTDDLPRHRAEISEIWGGALCVSEATHTLEELERIRSEVEQELADDGTTVLFSDAGDVDGIVTIGVTVADPDVQAELDERHGEGVVVLRGALTPLD